MDLNAYVMGFVEYKAPMWGQMFVAVVSRLCIHMIVVRAILGWLYLGIHCGPGGYRWLLGGIVAMM